MIKGKVLEDAIFETIKKSALLDIGSQPLSPSRRQNRHLAEYDKSLRLRLKATCSAVYLELFME